MAELAYREVYAMNRIEARRRLVQTYQRTRNYSETARLWHTSRHVVRKWVRRHQKLGDAGLGNRSRRPHHTPRQTPPEIEQQVLDAWKKTHYGRQRLAVYLERQGLHLSPYTIRHILRRHRPPQKRIRRKPLYPAHWAWEVEQPFSLIQTDASLQDPEGKDILDKGALGTQRTTHLRRQGLPRYQWTACDGRTRLRFLAYSHRIHRTNGLAFLILVLMWLRAFAIQTPVTFQTDWGQEFGGDNPEQVQLLSPGPLPPGLGRQFLQPLQGQLARYPKGRKGYNGRVVPTGSRGKRSHRTDDEEFYRPYLLNISDVQDFLIYSQRWVYFYNVLRPHFGASMNGRTPLAVLQSLGYTGDQVLTPKSWTR